MSKRLCVKVCLRKSIMCKSIIILYLKERMPCIGLCVDHGTEPGLVHFCDFFSISIATMFAHLCLQLRSPSGAALCERLCVKVSVEASV